MVHLDEHTLELYVTGSARVQNQKAAIEQHLEECATCSGLAARMREYYVDFHATLPEAGTGKVAAPGALARREDRVGRERGTEDGRIGGNDQGNRSEGSKELHEGSTGFAWRPFSGAVDAARNLG